MAIDSAIFKGAFSRSLADDAAIVADQLTDGTGFH